MPKDARTLLKINRNPSAEITTVEGGQYWYHGIQKCFNELSIVYSLYSYIRFVNLKQSKPSFPFNVFDKRIDRRITTIQK